MLPTHPNPRPPQLRTLFPVCELYLPIVVRLPPYHPLQLRALASDAINGWIDADWAASFFELSFAPGSLPPGLAGAEVIAAKVYLFQGSGVILHCVYFAGSMYCVLADSVEDLPLLDVAFPDVTARNRVVQVRGWGSLTVGRQCYANRLGSSRCVDGIV